VQLVNVHLYYGSESPRDVERRTLETVAAARWTALRTKSRYAGARELIALGDFNMPKPGSNGVAGGAPERRPGDPAALERDRVLHRVGQQLRPDGDAAADDPGVAGARSE
jgi:hypothetical protein